MAPATAAAPVVAGVRLSHPDRLVYPDLGISKRDLAECFDGIARWIVPHVKGRPLTLVHCPAGVASPCLFLKHAKAWRPTALRRVRIKEKTKVGEYLVADDAAGVVSLAQMGIVEIHTWNSTFHDLERPNRVVWDLDPGPAVKWSAVVEAAKVLRDVLATLSLEAWVKTTGRRGIHVVAPLQPSLDWSGCLEFSRAVGDAIVRTDRSRFTLAFRKAGRERQILIDYLRNNRTNTSICADSPRARPEAPVSLPVTWADLRHDPREWTLPAVSRRLQRRRTDPWGDTGRRDRKLRAGRSMRSPDCDVDRVIHSTA
jgi:bifunctional non-homologous end joining protein LigD